ncbi:S28 family serine protease [Sorangium sp. So ce887]|uniref:S28 family serine protease n=1 Tax=Sorangium sp. So ce887 TaxID=3133324 RepID=UPI003F637CAA
MASLTLPFALLGLAACGDGAAPPGPTTSTQATTSSSGAGGDGSTSSSSAGGSGGSGGSGGDGITSSSSAGGSGGDGGSGGVVQPDVLEQLRELPGVTNVVEDRSALDDYRFFLIDFDQPIDHADPAGQHFSQRLALHHRDAGAPLVLANSGYFLMVSSEYQYIDEPTGLLGANQLNIEHRYFTPSRPEPADWTRLNIEQAAADQHSISEAFHALYTGPWISTGASKGGMTSVYHHRFYPEDVDGTVAYVAPHSNSVADPRYVDFLNEVGDAGCRQALRDFQREALLRRDAMLARMAEQATILGGTYDLFGLDATLESTAISLAFGFWQSHGQYRCADIPSQEASDNEVWGFLDEIGSPFTASDSYMLALEPYYWQAYTQLGAPAIDTSYFEDLLLFDWGTVDALPSVPIEPEFDPAPMQDISAWLAAEGERILFIYGETDPWTAGAFELGGARDSYKLVMPGGNHSASIDGLVAADQQTALTALETWTGVSPRSPSRLLRSRPTPLPPSFQLLHRLHRRSHR